ncbi:ribosome-associated translation inhibitor RaiA [Patescibacteria group bacterium]|nr:ribosome-associated translation inhibitor RaiA [Patescibacteria group bacterium]
MDFIISGKNFKLTPSIKKYVQDKFSKLSKYWGKIIRARIELKVDKAHKSGQLSGVDVVLEVPGPDIRAEQKASEMHEAIDLVMPKLERQLNKAKDKNLAREKFNPPVLDL